MNRLRFAIAILAGLAGANAPAESIFRCGNEYTNVACADARAVVVAGAVTAEQRVEAREVARREKALAAEMTRDRREQEALARPALAGSLSAPRTAAAPPATTAKRQPKKHRKSAATDEQRDFIASVPKVKKSGT